MFVSIYLTIWSKLRVQQLNTWHKKWHYWRKFRFIIKPINNMGNSPITYKHMQNHFSYQYEIHSRHVSLSVAICKPNRWTTQIGLREAHVVVRLHTWDNLLWYHKKKIWGFIIKLTENKERVNKLLISTCKIYSPINIEFIFNKY